MEQINESKDFSCTGQGQNYNGIYDSRQFHLEYFLNPNSIIKMSTDLTHHKTGSVLSFKSYTKCFELPLGLFTCIRERERERERVEQK